MPAHELAPEHAFLPDRRVPRAQAQPRAPDDDLALLDHGTRVRGDESAVDARAVARAEVPHLDAPVFQQRQQRVARRGMFVLDDDGAAEVTADAAFGAGALEALPHDPVPVRVDLLDQHHGVHCSAPRYRSSVRLPDSNPTPWSVSRLTSASSGSSMPTTVTSKS